MKNLLNKIGVKQSVIVTISAFLLMLIALIAENTEIEYLKSFAVISIMIVVVYGVYSSVLMLRNKEKYIHLLPFLVLNWFIGCFATNIIINIFHNLPYWVFVLTFMYCISFMVIFYNSVSSFLTKLAFFVNGLSIVLILYFMIYLIPYMLFSAIGIIALGIGFFGLVPLIVLILQIINFIKNKYSKVNYVFLALGFFTSLAIIVTTTVLLQQEIENINGQSITKSFNNHEDIPTYIKVSQNYQNSFLNEVILKKNLVYTATDNIFEMGRLNFFNGTQYNERKVHHPLYNIAYFFCEDLNLSEEDQVRILQSNFDKRLETEEQLWSGARITTKNIKEDVQIFPETRIAYTEFTLDITTDDTWQQEGIYAFQLPEGSVATSLSLWVNGIERKGILTTKEKAQKSYNQIVGVENRDPSLMQWREGNRIVVRVFPISKNLPRTFKCGFTTPLKIVDNELIYESISIKGPKMGKAEVLTRLQIMNQLDFKSSKIFDFKNGFQINNSIGLENWKVNLKHDNVFKNNSFVWKNNMYETQNLVYENVAFEPSEIILDLNKFWTNKEIEQILSNNKTLYCIINDVKTELNINNYKNILQRFNTLNYSLLPFYYFKENSLIITKSNGFSANFEELKDSGYLNKVKEKCISKNIKVFNISNEINPFWQTMKEQKQVTFITFSLEKALEQINKKQISLPKIDNNSIVIENAKISIVKKDSEVQSTMGNDHIYRLYAFNKVMNEHVTQINDSIPNKYVTLAQDANIVTPITSLIVLETDADYEKHGIDKNPNGLGNASVKNEGAVPEPHEWALIFISLITIWFFYMKPQKTIND
jgi:XrtN system VIT domain protein